MFNQIFSKKVIVPFFQFLGIIAIFTFIVFPGLTAADTIVNIFSLIIGFFTLLALYYFVKSWFQKDELTDEQTKEMLESELGPVIDKMAKEVLAKPKKKSNPKQFDGVKSDEPFIKTRTKPKTEKVMGEYQLNNKEKVRKSVTKNIK